MLRRPINDYPKCFWIVKIGSVLMEIYWLEVSLISLISRYKGKVPYKFEHIKCWNFQTYCSLLCRPIDNNHSIKRIIKIGSIVIDYDLVEVLRKHFILLVLRFTIVLYGWMVEFIADIIFILLCSLIHDSLIFEIGIKISLIVMEIYHVEVRGVPLYKGILYI